MLFPDGVGQLTGVVAVSLEVEIFSSSRTFDDSAMINSDTVEAIKQVQKRVCVEYVA